MHGRLEPVIAQSHQVITDIHNDGISDRRRLDPLALLIQHLQPTHHVLPEQGEALQVGVRAEANVLAHRGLLGGHGGVVVEDTVAPGIRGEAVEVVFRQIETESENSDQTAGQFETFLPVGDAAVFEVREV